MSTAVAPGAPDRERILVKVVSKIPAATWLHQFPHGVPAWGKCDFVFDRDAQTYDWLIVYDDLPAREGEAGKISQETLACPRAHTLLVTTEPPSIKIYGDDYTHQFGVVLTSQPDWALPHPDRVHAQPALHWFYGLGATATRGFDEILAEQPDAKTRDASMVYSPKSMRHTLHHERARFMRLLAERMPELDTFGRGTQRPLGDKAECLREYRYHVAIENHVGAHHWTEKLADPFLGLALPFYFGCPNAEAYFPEGSFIRIDIRDPDAALQIMRSAMAADVYAERLPALIEAKRRVMYEYNLFAVTTAIIAARHRPARASEKGAAILSRRALRRSSLGVAWRDFVGKVRGRLRARSDS